jgi:hypothetical protein
MSRWGILDEPLEKDNSFAPGNGRRKENRVHSDLPKRILGFTDRFGFRFAIFEGGNGLLSGPIFIAKKLHCFSRNETAENSEDQSDTIRTLL